MDAIRRPPWPSGVLILVDRQLRRFVADVEQTRLVQVIEALHEASRSAEGGDQRRFVVGDAESVLPDTAFEGFSGVGGVAAELIQGGALQRPMLSDRHLHVDSVLQTQSEVAWGRSRCACTVIHRAFVLAPEPAVYNGLARTGCLDGKGEVPL